MNFDVYCDESGPELLHSEKPKARFMVIGSLWLPEALRVEAKAALHTRLAAVHACAGAAQCDPLLATPISVRLADGTDFEVVDPLAFEAELAAATRAPRAANS
jgi:hypothetical protein